MKTIKYRHYIFFDKRQVGSVRKLIRRYGVKHKSYAGEVLERIYCYYFGDAVNVSNEYKKYYKNEFKNLDKFLECHLGIPEKVRKLLLPNKKILYVDLSEKCQFIGYAFDFDDDDELNCQFWDMVGGIEDEDSLGLCYEQFFD